MYQQSIEKFYDRFPSYGIGVHLPCMGQLFLCNTNPRSGHTIEEAEALGELLYAARLDEQTVLVVSVQEYHQAYCEEAMQWEGPTALCTASGDYNPNNVSRFIARCQYWMAK